MLRSKRNKMFGTINANFVAKRLSLEKLSVNKSCTLSPRHQGAMILETLRKFQQSADIDISQRHVPVWGKIKNLPESDRKKPLEYSVAHAIRLWKMMLDPYNTIPLGHDGYYKLWALSDPVIPADYIMVDESQDTNGAMLGVLKRQKAQMVFVGDRFQQIYEWRGAVNAMSSIRTELDSSLTMSFRFGKVIADAASRVLSKLGADDRIVGNPLINSRLGCTNPKAILCRTNAGVIEHLLKALELGIRPHVIGGNGEILRLLRAVAQLKSGLPVDVPEFFGFTDWQQVMEYAETEEGSHLSMLVRLVERYGEDYLIKVLSDMHQSEQTAESIISTVHRAKGRQWSNVLVNGDFSLITKSSDDEELFKAEELRLFYTAVTRAQNELQIPPRQAELLGIQQRTHD